MHRPPKHCFAAFVVAIIILISVGWLKWNSLINTCNVVLPQTVVYSTATCSSPTKQYVPRLVLTTSNEKLVDFTENLLRSIEKTKTYPVLIVDAEDETSLRALSNHTYPKLHFRNSHDVSKLKLLLEYLQLGLEVFYVNADAYWFRDPFPYFEGSFDFALTKDRPRVWNVGLGYYKPTHRTLQFLKRWIELLETTKGSKEQDILNKLLSSRYIPDLKIRLLNSENFPNAGYFFPMYPALEKCRIDTSDTIVFFAEYIANHTEKKTALQKCKMWINNGTVGF
ncbi:UDP-D-xylose:L-fucose alpha-1,3-D-xylosyltransferase-like [Patiria miniata]|uniref:Nucleotide-diphospho-sugar transferase domain-containing protein n=1 Tax=Patiria miniata TaxID=46514 RepID=A0A914BD57_PATMI|nr:UDP-D-xylose:L-fucose alpha-1,3-D-xylosyltransferase-like [Patiria miniata]